MRQYAKPERIPLLEEVLETMKGKDFFVDIELKAYAASWGKRKIGAEVAKIVRRMDIMDQVVCTSFNFFMLYNLEKAHRDVPSGFAYADDMPLSEKWLNRLMESNIIGRVVHSNAVCSEYNLIDEDTVAKYHKRNMKVGCFTLYPLTPGEVPPEKKAHYSSEVKDWLPWEWTGLRRITRVWSGKICAMKSEI